MTDLEKKLLETNYELSMALAGYRINGHISHLFGLPLDEVADIIIKHRKEIDEKPKSFL